MSVPLVFSGPSVSGATVKVVLQDLDTNNLWDDVNETWSASPTEANTEITLTEGTGKNIGRWIGQPEVAAIGSVPRVLVSYYVNSVFAYAEVITIISNATAVFGLARLYWCRVSVSQVAGNDYYRVTFYRDQQLLKSGVSSVTITVRDQANNTTLINAASMSQDGSTATWEYTETSSLTTFGPSYGIEVNWTADGAARGPSGGHTYQR